MKFLRSSCLGCQNNNFGNIRFSKLTKWRGQTGQNHGFVVFENYQYGIRALYILLRTYIDKHKLTDVFDIIDRYAPPSENDSLTYAQFVFERVSFPVISSEGLSVIQLMCAIMMYESMVVIEPKEVLEILHSFGLCCPKKMKI